ncbi:MAG TPA: MbcA/ParS/Xre antitoxin family protein [Terracidiphilus sp.]|nr:MbcA/ParS/Xre antitoxin family protein [Terracidiphilus sp.]
MRAAQEMMRYKTLIERTVDAFGDEIKASRWLSLPSRDFDGQTPLQAAQKSGYDLAAIEPILIRIEHGVEF